MAVDTIDQISGRAFRDPDFLQRLHETGHLGKVPIIVVSAHLREDPKAVLQMGVSAILPKPFNLPELIDLIEHLSP